MNDLAAILMFATISVFVCLILEVLDGVKDDPISSYEHDEIMCNQMRDQGWTEDEIKDYMNELESHHYIDPDGEA